MTTQATVPISTQHLSGQLKGFWMWLARGLWVGLVLMVLAPNIFSIPAYYRELTGNPQKYSFTQFGDYRDWQPAQLHQAADNLGLSLQTVAVITLISSVLNLVIFMAVGLLIFWFKSNTWLGLFSSFILAGLSVGLGGLPNQLSGVPLIDQFNQAGGFFWPFFFIFLLIYPNGRFDPPWVRYFGFLWIILGLVSELSRTLNNLLLPLFLICFILNLVLPIYRYFRRASPIERLQMRWFAFSILVFALYWFSGIPGSNLYLTLSPSIQAYAAPRLVYEFIYGQLLRLLVNAVLPISIALAIFRYRLWEIDLIIRRTLVYGGLTTLLALVYFGSITLLQSLLTRLTGQQSPVALVVTTLLIAALFSPLRRWVQALVDRAFYRRKYNAANALEEFSQMARNTVELNDLVNNLAVVVANTVQPASLTLWLAPRLPGASPTRMSAPRIGWENSTPSPLLASPQWGEERGKRT